MKVGEKVFFVVVYVFMCIYRKLQTLTTNIKTTRNMFISQDYWIVLHVPIYSYLEHVLIYLTKTHTVEFKFTENNSKLGKYMFTYHI